MPEFPIVVTKIHHGYEIKAGLWCSGQLTWDEAIGTLAAMLVPARTQSRVGHLHPAMSQIQDGIRWQGLIGYFGNQ